MTLSKVTRGIAVLSVVCACTSIVDAQIVVSVLDGKQKMLDGVNTVTGSAEQDGVTVFDFTTFPPRRLVDLRMPTSLVGPPSGAAVNLDESLAVVTAAQKLDPADPKKTIPDNRVTVIDLKSIPPAIAGSVEAGYGASGVSFSPDGRTVVVANRNEGTLSVFAVAAGKLQKADTVKVGGPASGSSHAAFTPDGMRLLVTRDGDSFISVFNVQDGKILAAGTDITAGVRPYALAVAPDGNLAVVGNIGRGRGDADSIAVVDLTHPPVRTIAFHTVASQPEAVAISLDGRWVAVGRNNGSSRRADSPFFNANGSLSLFAVEDASLVKKGEYPIGRWVQGITFTPTVRCLPSRTRSRENSSYSRSPTRGSPTAACGFLSACRPPACARGTSANEPGPAAQFPSDTFNHRRPSNDGRRSRGTRQSAVARSITVPASDFNPRGGTQECPQIC